MSVSRRDFLALVGSSVAGAAAGAVALEVAGASGSQAPVSRDWIVQSVGAVKKGAVPITLVDRNSRTTLVLNACRKANGSGAVASSAHCDLFVVNDGQGGTQTPRDHVIAARALARHLDAKQIGLPAAVLTQGARLAKHRDLHDTADDFAHA
jgi:hypothetical protein